MDAFPRDAKAVGEHIQLDRLSTIGHAARHEDAALAVPQYLMRKLPHAAAGLFTIQAQDHVVGFAELEAGKLMRGDDAEIHAGQPDEQDADGIPDGIYFYQILDSEYNKTEKGWVQVIR